MKLIARLLVPAGMLLTVACGSQAPVERSAPQVLYADSAGTAEEHMQRFTADLADRPTELSGGAATPEQLASRFVEAVQQRDTVALMQTHLSRAEFAYLYYPTHPQAQPPYSLPPDLMWMMLEAQSTRGVADAVSQLPEEKARLEAVHCRSVSRHAENQLHLGCSATLGQAAAGGTSASLPLGAIMERGGRFKFVSFGTGG